MEKHEGTVIACVKEIASGNLPNDSGNLNWGSVIT